MGDRLPELKGQVGGHKIMKVYRDNFVCKPLDTRESMFYHSYPKHLAPFLPRFAGILSVGSIASQDDFILLENLCSGFRKPCVLDLKMGTRMYNDQATEKKRKSQDQKTNQTTSGKLGVRLCGYQRYSKSTSSFQKVDKYVGRQVDVPKLQEMLHLFFSIGGRLQSGVIKSVLHQIGRLRRVVTELEGFRFYSSSILIVFEGDQPDYLNERTEDCDDSSKDGEDGSQDGEDGSQDGEDNSSLRQTPVVKLIDFANVTFPGFSKDDIYHQGPDAGLIFGLDNSCEILNKILKQPDSLA